jgi:hypothetical protein
MKSERKYERYDTNTRAKVRNFGGPDWSEVLLVNLSKGGACIESSVSFERSTIIEIIVNSPNPEVRMHNFLARVVWSEGQRFGIQFMSRL